jgi:hypothetical protein
MVIRYPKNRNGRVFCSYSRAAGETGWREATAAKRQQLKVADVAIYLKALNPQ